MSEGGDARRSGGRRRLLAPGRGVAVLGSEVEEASGPPRDVPPVREPVSLGEPASVSDGSEPVSGATAPEPVSAAARRFEAEGPTLEPDEADAPSSEPVAPSPRLAAAPDVMAVSEAPPAAVVTGFDEDGLPELEVEPLTTSEGPPPRPSWGAAPVRVRSTWSSLPGEAGGEERIEVPLPPTIVPHAADVPELPVPRRVDGAPPSPDPLRRAPTPVHVERVVRPHRPGPRTVAGVSPPTSPPVGQAPPWRDPPPREPPVRAPARLDEEPTLVIPQPPEEAPPTEVGADPRTLPDDAVVPPTFPGESFGSSRPATIPEAVPLWVMVAGLTVGVMLAFSAIFLLSALVLTVEPDVIRTFE